MMHCCFRFAGAALFASIFPVSALADNFGAIAYSPQTGASAWSYDFSSRRAAEQNALQRCRSSASDCQIVVWFFNNCGAVAVDAGNTASFAVAWGESRARAEREALKNCGQTGKACSIDTWACNSAGGGSGGSTPAYAQPPSFSPSPSPGYTPPTYRCPPGYLVNGHQCY